MEDQNDLYEKDQKGSNIARLLHLRQQQNLINRVRHLIGTFEQITQFQRQVITLNHKKWSKIDSSIESVQADIDWYVKEYIMPIQERKQELSKLENSLVSVSEPQGIVGKVGKFFERFIPGITKEGRKRRSIEDRKHTIEDEISTYEIMKDKNPFQIFGANKDAKGELLARMDTTQLDRYSTGKNDFRNNLNCNSTVKSVADSIKVEDMNSLLDSYPALKGENSHLISELINNGIESFNTMVAKIVKDSTQEREELMSQIDFEVQEDNDKDILNDIAEQIQGLMSSLTPEELEELRQIEQPDSLEI